MSRLILASRSPRRLELLTRFGIPFETFVPDVDETCDLPAAEAVEAISRRKARATASSFPDAFILAADTLVSADGVSLGKPSGREDAVRMLRLLSGRTHQVYTGVSVCSPGGRLLTETDCSDVSFCSVPEEEILAYVRSGEPMDKAGAYGIQGLGSLLVQKIDGEFYNVVGLPVSDIAANLEGFLKSI
jgi:septum formation protein